MSYDPLLIGQYNSTLPTVTSGSGGPLQTDANGRLMVGNFPTTQAVTGTFFPATQPVSLTALPALPTGANTIGAVTQASGPWTVSWSGQSLAATQSGTWTVALAAGSAAIGSVSVTGSVAVTGTFYQATQPVSGTVTANAGTGTMAVSAASLPLPAGAATSAKQPALGTAGSASTDVLSIQGIAGGVAQPVSVVNPTLTFVVTSVAASSLLLKGSAGSFYSTYVTTGATAGYLMLFDATTAPADGTVAPKEAFCCPANSTTSIDYSSTPQPFATGIMVVFSSTGPFTKTASATAYIKGAVA